LLYSFFYFLLGGLFVMIGINHATETGSIFNVMTLLLTAIATLDIGMGIRFLKNRPNSDNNSK